MKSYLFALFSIFFNGAVLAMENCSIAFSDQKSSEEVGSDELTDTTQIKSIKDRMLGLKKAIEALRNEQVTKGPEDVKKAPTRCMLKESASLEGKEFDPPLFRNLETAKKAIVSKACLLVHDLEKVTKENNVPVVTPDDEWAWQERVQNALDWLEIAQAEMDTKDVSKSNLSRAEFTTKVSCKVLEIIFNQ